MKFIYKYLLIIYYLKIVIKGYNSLNPINSNYFNYFLFLFSLYYN